MLVRADIVGSGSLELCALVFRPLLLSFELPPLDPIEKRATKPIGDSSSE